jgi:hypothetical protein
MLFILSGRTSKTEFVWKSYGQSKFDVQNWPKLSNSDWTRREHGQPDLYADLTFFLDFLNFFLNFFWLAIEIYLTDSGNSTGEIGRNKQNLILLGWGNRGGETAVTCVAAEMAVEEVYGVVAEVYGGAVV